MEIKTPVSLSSPPSPDFQDAVAASPGRTQRVVSVDAYRGLVMILILAEVLSSCQVSAALPGSILWASVCYEQTHAAWVGMSLHDFIQPSFYFLVGLSLFLSMSRKRAAGLAASTVVRQVALRSVGLIVLGLVLSHHWMWRFVDTLTQIGLAYPFLFLIASRSKKVWAAALALILVGDWLLFAMSPYPLPDVDYARVGVSDEWLRAHGLNGFASHWQKNVNIAAVFDEWFLNLFPRGTSYVGEQDGLTTLNFIPSIATMICGLFAGDVLRSAETSLGKAKRLAVAGGVSLFAGWALGAAGISPVVKAIWTPAWVLFSGGWCLLAMAAFFSAVDISGHRRVVFPLVVVGMNSIVAYAISRVYPAFAFNSFRRIVGNRPFQFLGPAYEPFLYGVVVLGAYWVFLYLLYRKRLFLRL